MPFLFRLFSAAALAVSPFSIASCGSDTQTISVTNAPQPEVVYKPQITIRNNSYKNIVLGVKGPETRFISIPAQSSKSVSLLPGSYKYAATAQNTNVVKGFKDFETNRQYTWNLSIN